MAEEILVFLSKDGGPHKLARALPALPAGSEVVILACAAESKLTTPRPCFMQRLRSAIGVEGRTK